MYPHETITTIKIVSYMSFSKVPHFTLPPFPQFKLETIKFPVTGRGQNKELHTIEHHPTVKVIKEWILALWI
jgi:hypothetical protein